MLSILHSTMAGTDRNGEELLGHWTGAWLGAIYASESGPFVAFRRRLLVRLILRLEGGEMRSRTLRRIMARCHGVEVGAYSYGCFDPIRAPSGSRFGRYVSVGPEVAIYRRNHPLGRLTLHPYFYRPELSGSAVKDVATSPLIVADDAWIGARALILPGCGRIGRGAVVAAGAVVTKDVPDYAVVAGSPARVIRHRFEESERDAAERTGWWQLPPEQVLARYPLNDVWSVNEAEEAR